MLPTTRGSNKQPPDDQSDAHPTEPPRPAVFCNADLYIIPSIVGGAGVVQSHSMHVTTGHGVVSGGGIVGHGVGRGMSGQVGHTTGVGQIGHVIVVGSVVVGQGKHGAAVVCTSAAQSHVVGAVTVRQGWNPPLVTKNTQNHENRRLGLIESLHMQHCNL